VKSDSLHWLLSFYRTSEITGALFFGQLARRLKPGPIQADLTRHFADEAQHARYWTDCLAALGEEPMKLSESYQDRYLAAAGVPVNLLEVLAVTLVFEQRVIGQYAQHKRAEAKNGRALGPVEQTIDRIMADERWHIAWVSKALGNLGDRFGEDTVRSTVRRYRQADNAVFSELTLEYGHRLEEVMT
jgi:rubrerythrin